MENLSERDARHIWHPLTQHQTHPAAWPIQKAEGVYLYDEAGRKYIDAISSWYTAVYGHCHPEITGPVARQMQELDQVVFAGFTHRPAVELAERLLGLLPGNQEKVFFSDNGSTSVEVAIKMALQYHFNQGNRRQVLLALEEGFHGDTFGAMSVSGLSVYNGPFQDLSLEVIRLPAPTGKNNEAALEMARKMVAEHAVAALIYEPLVQGAAGMRTLDPDGLAAILEVVREAGGLLIADEVMTGFGKTGTHFASEQLSLKPDLICLSKALTAGLVPMGLTSCTREVFEAFLGQDTGRGFFHGHTYTANPLACRAALAALDLLQSPAIQEGIRHISGQHEAFARELDGHPMVEEVRHCGVIFALDLKVQTDRYSNFRDTLYRFFMDRGVYLRPLGNTVYLLPPYITAPEELETLYAAIRELLDTLEAGTYAG